MSKLENIVIPRDADTVDPKVYASIFDTDEAHLVQERVAQVRTLINPVLRDAGVSLISNTTGRHVPGALLADFHTRLPEPIYEKYDKDYRTGATHNGAVTGTLRIPADEDRDFRIEYYGYRTTGPIGWFGIEVPSSPETNQIPAVDMDATRSRLTLLGIAAAAEFSRDWVIPGPRFV